jgi:hypothetical protein
MLAMVPLSRCWPSLVRVPSPTARVLPLTIRVPSMLVRVVSSTVLVLPSTAKVSIVKVSSPTAKVLIDRRGVAANHQGAFVDRKVPSLVVRAPLIFQCETEKALAMRCVDRGGYRSRRMDLHACPMVGVKCCGL